MLSGLVVDGRDDEATRVFCEVSRQLHAAGFEPGGIRPLAGLADTYARHLAGGSTVLPASTVQHARDTWEMLCATQRRSVLLHGDLHHDNLLYDERRGWRCIDPVGYIGEPEFEAAAFLKNPLSPRYCADERIVHRRTTIMADVLGLDPQRILRWAYSYYVASLIWGIEDAVFEREHLLMLSVLEKFVAL